MMMPALIIIGGLCYGLFKEMQAYPLKYSFADEVTKTKAEYGLDTDEEAITLLKAKPCKTSLRSPTRLNDIALDTMLRYPDLIAAKRVELGLPV